MGAHDPGGGCAWEKQEQQEQQEQQHSSNSDARTTVSTDNSQCVLTNCDCSSPVACRPPDIRMTSDYQQARSILIHISTGKPDSPELIPKNCG